MLGVPLPRLVVIDYAEGVDPAGLEGFLDGLRRRASGIAPVRVLLLTRTRAGAIRDPLAAMEASASAALAALLDRSQDNAAAAAPLSGLQRAALYQEAVTAFRAAWHGDQGVANGPAGPSAELSGERYANALDVLFEALDTALGGRESSSSGRPPVQRALTHEERYWRATAPRAGTDDRVLREGVALATLAGAADPVAADALLALAEPLAAESSAAWRRELADWLASLYPGPGKLNPLTPDRLGEALVSQVLADQQDGGRALLSRVLRLGQDSQVERALEVIARLSAYDDAAARSAAAAYGRLHRVLTQRAEDQARSRPGRLALASALQRLLTPRFRALIEQLPGEPGNTTYQRDLAVSYNKLGDLARASGQGERARELYQQSLDIVQGLAGAEPGNTTYQRGLAVSYNKLGDLAVVSGQGERAGELFQRSLDVVQGLAGAEPGNTTYQRDLAVSYNKLGDLARASGQGEPGPRAVPAVPGRGAGPGRGGAGEHHLPAGPGRLL